MGKSTVISHYRERLDRILASPDLMNHDALKSLVRNQLLDSSLNENEGCSEKLLEKRTSDVSYFLDMLRSASLGDNETSHGEWKLKDDKEEYRVMYREGLQGSPFHTLLVEGYVDGPIDTCLCISWESILYKKWFPQFNFPPFKIIIGKCLQKVRIGEQLSLVRVKVTWPLSTREAVLHYVTFEYLKDGLIIVLINTISDSESIDRATHGFSKDVIPAAKDVVRIDLIGGFALQKVTSERSYFRTIANMDVKLDFVPPTLVNFISRQLIGSGFRLYQKTVASVSNYDKDYSKALEEPMYARIREPLYSTVKPNQTMEGYAEAEQKSFGNMEWNAESLLENARIMDKKAFDEIEEEKSEKSLQLKDKIRNMEQNDHANDLASENSQINPMAMGSKTFDEIEEEIKDSRHRSAQKSRANYKRRVLISPAVEQALETLEKAILMVREYGFNAQASSMSSAIGEESANLENGTKKDSSAQERNGICSNGKLPVETSEKRRTVERTSHESRNSSSSRDIRRVGSNSSNRELNHNKIAPASPEQCLSIPGESNQAAKFPPKNGMSEIPIIDLTTQEKEEPGIDENSIRETSSYEGKHLNGSRKHWLCCFNVSSGR